MDSIKKDPGAKLPYGFNWTNWLDGETITASAWTVPTGLTEASNTFDLITTTIWLTGGTAGTDYTVMNQITSSGGKKDQRSIVVYVRDR